MEDFENSLVPVYLRDWGLSEETIKNFCDNEITIDLLYEIQDNDLKELVPLIKERILFRVGVRKLEKITHETASEDTNSVPASPTTCSSCSSFAAKTNADPKQIPNVLCTLSFLASGSYQRICGKNINTYVSQPSVSRCVHEVVEVLSHPDVVKKYIRFPQNSAERLRLKEKFFSKYKIPGVIGCVDGTYITMVRPKLHEERYYCRKGNHARNVQLITDADLNILHVDATYGGATHDSFIFSNCIIQPHLENLVQTGETVYLLGDSGYTQRPYLMVPVPNAEAGSPEEYYNKLHATARNTVERAIGRLKGRFRCLLVHRVLHYEPDMVAKIVIACCVLHNICNRAGLPAPALEVMDEVVETRFHTAMHARGSSVEDITGEVALGQSSRQELINILWRARNIVT